MRTNHVTAVAVPISLAPFRQAFRVIYERVELAPPLKLSLAFPRLPIHIPPRKTGMHLVDGMSSLRERMARKRCRGQKPLAKNHRRHAGSYRTITAAMA